MYISPLGVLAGIVFRYPECFQPVFGADFFFHNGVFSNIRLIATWLLEGRSKEYMEKAGAGPFCAGNR